MSGIFGFMSIYVLAMVLFMSSGLSVFVACVIADPYL